MSQKQRNKIGRNETCPCNSGIKYKHCHGHLNENASQQPSDFISKEISTLKALDVQRKLQQGLGNPIVSTEHNSLKVVAVGNEIYKGKWITFHDFLVDYIKLSIGSAWGNEELKKPYENRHPLIKIYNKICDYQKSFVKTSGQVHSAPFTGAVSAYMWLAYNLYIIAHNAELHQRLIKRLRHPEQFPGAYYETYIAAIFIKAGFLLEFENEEDKTTSHCEFIATHKETGNKYSVEAKYRHRKNFISSQGSENFKINIDHLLHQALEKETPHERIIFIDINIPTSEMEKHTPSYLSKRLKKCENDPINGNPAPPAYVFLTNLPYHYDLEETVYKAIYFAEGFKIPDFGNKKATLQEAIQARKKHRPIHDLFNSIKTHTIIPTTFDGSFPEFTFRKSTQRLIIGDKYIVNDPEGNEQLIELLQATVDEPNKKAWTLCRNTNGQTQLIQIPLTDDEVNAYKQSPDTFFGIYHEQGKKISDPIEMFDFFMKGHQLLTKEDILIRLKNYPNHDELLMKTRDELLEIYCVGITCSIYNKAN